MSDYIKEIQINIANKDISRDWIIASLLEKVKALKKKLELERDSKYKILKSIGASDD